VASVAFNQDESLAVAGSWDGTIRWWDVTSGRQQGSYVVGNYLNDIALNPTNNTIFIGAWTPSLLVYDLDTQSIVHEFPDVDGDWIESVAVNADGTRGLATLNNNAAVGLFDLETGEKLNEFPIADEYIRSVEFSPDGTMAAAGGTTGKLYLIDLQTGDVRVLTGHSPVAGYSAAFSPDGKTLASAGADFLVRLWDVASGEQTDILAGHNNEVNDVRFSTDGTHLITASSDETIRLWDIATSEVIYTLYATGSPVTSAALNMNEERVLFGSTDWVVRLWQPVRVDDLTRWAQENRQIPALSCIERTQYRIKPLCADN